MGNVMDLVGMDKSFRMDKSESGCVNKKNMFVINYVFLCFSKCSVRLLSTSSNI